MKKAILLLVSLSFSFVASHAMAQDTPVANDSPLKTKGDKLGYSIGLDIARSMQRLSGQVDLNMDMVQKGLNDGLSGGKALLTPEQIQVIMSQFQQEMRAKQAELQKGEQQKQEKERQMGSSKNKEEGDKFLAANKAKPGVITLASGLQYRVIRPGTGKTPKATDRVETHYKGTLLNGEEFDSSYKRNQPATFPVKGVIAGWTEALQLMKEGGKWELYIPSNLAYGARGAGQKIGPNATLIFEIELLAIK